MKINGAKTEPLSLGPVLQDELAEINKIRGRRNPQGADYGLHRQVEPEPEAPIAGTASSDEPQWRKPDSDWVTTITAAHNANLVGLAFSGGGIRSAAFNLGVLQALAELKLLFRVDYLSTVSGGGYIGGWLAAWIKRLGSFAEVQKRLATNRVHQEEDNEPLQIRFLRVFSNYLTPKLGLSGDTCAAAAISLRNILLNQVIVLAVLVSLLLLPRFVLFIAAPRLLAASHTIRLGGLLTLLAVALVITASNFTSLDLRGRAVWRWLTKQKLILWSVAAPLFAAAAIGALWHTPALSYKPVMWVGVTDYVGVWAVALCAVGIFWVVAWERQRQSVTPQEASEKRAKVWERVGNVFWMLFGAVPAGALAGWLYAVFSRYRVDWSLQADLTFGVPLVVVIFLLAATLHTGVMGVAFRDDKREWWGRLGGWLLLWAVAWLVMFSVALYFPDFISSPWAVKLLKKYVTPGWIVTTGAGLFVAKRGDTSGTPGQLNWKDWLAKAAPYIFVMGLVCWVSFGIDRLLLGWHPPLLVDYTWLYVLAGSAAVAAFMAWRVDVNQFSMHDLYRNRLVRCFLGASNPKRAPNRFTGFDETDDIPLSSLKDERDYDGPYPLLNASLNLVKGQDLAWQERKAASFVMTPLYCGYDVWLEEQDSPITRQERKDEEQRSQTRRLQGRLRRYGYRPTEEFAYPPPAGQGLPLGTAMAISGAAATPNMGFYTSMPVAFLMTVFNVRLGQWLGNPRHRSAWRRPAPRWALRCLLKELLAGTTDEASYVYLSDGGHFDNMGLYELVKRRCGLIIICDAEADGQYQYRGLGNAIRKCRIDMGIEIDLDVTDTMPEKTGEPSKKHWAVGTIHYENVDLNAPKGKIIYFKASLTGDEPTDLQNYRKTHDAFPHDSTADQWFSESQFECYRKLGYHVVKSSLEETAVTPAEPAAGRWFAAKVGILKAFLGAPEAKETVSEPCPANTELAEIFSNFGLDADRTAPRE